MKNIKMNMPIGLLTAAMLVACSSEQAGSEYEAVVEKLDTAQANQTNALQDIDHAYKELDVAKTELDKALAELRAATKNIERLEQEARTTATDRVLFEALQSTYVDDERFDNARIVVLIENGKVTLRGKAKDSATIHLADRIAQQQPGVVGVHNQITLKNTGAADSNNEANGS